MQALRSNTRLPATAPASSTAGFCWAPTQLAKSFGPSTEMRSSIFACCTPQYWAHWPRKTPVRCGSIHVLLGWLGMRSEEHTAEVPTRFDLVCPHLLVQSLCLQ